MSKQNTAHNPKAFKAEDNRKRTIGSKEVMNHQLSAQTNEGFESDNLAEKGSLISKKISIQSKLVAYK